MNKLVRQFQSGDEPAINNLYRMITGIDRSIKEHNWEWVNTWRGIASMYLIFDQDRPADDQLIAQYSLIPTPLSVWGQSYLSGKTENCMSHPAIRGSGVFFYHERDSFNIAQQTYQFFFTTSGQVAKGAPGAIRKKLGYLPFDSWVRYIYWLDTGGLYEVILRKWVSKQNNTPWWKRCTASVFVKLIHFYLLWFQPGKVSGTSQTISESEAPLDEITTLWQTNKTFYGISIDRNRAYMEWRINQNPYIVHQYLVLRDKPNGHLIGYLIFTHNSNLIDVVDMLADTKQKKIFKQLLNDLKRYARENGVNQIRFSILRRSKFLARRLRAAGFIPNHIFSWATFRKSILRNQFYVFIPQDLKHHPEMTRPESWYVTDLFREGRPYD